MKKDLILKMLKAKNERKQQLADKSKTVESVEELRSINAELERINSEIDNLEKVKDEIEEEERKAAEGGEQRQEGPVGKGGVLGSFVAGEGKKEERQLGRYETMEYRKAFMKYVMTGEMSEELRADATTTTADASAVIPTTILNKIVEKMEDFGRIWSRITKSNVKAGLEIPVSSVKPVATWVSEGTVVDKQKKTATAKISFSYYKLQVRVAVTLEASTVSLSAFEATVADNVYEAMIVAAEGSVITGSGSGQPLGIAKDTDIPAEQIISVSATDISTYKKWTELFGKVPRKYRSGAVLILNDADWTKYIEGMVDANGQPVARVTYGLDGKQSERFLGKEVIPVEDYLDSIDDAVSGDVIGIICRLKDYLFNTNLQMTTRRYFDEDTDEWITKSTMLADGKLSDKNGVVLIKKK